ncbi:MAG TPA: ribonuclease P protein subunit [Candidatus Poseidoniaceae archaeon]|jgi:RNase P/RNase MRP subunit p29|nr:MAG TPA: ribonuclease P protein subunit [Candidatus Poseidoniales archaeon]HII10508.1 ribonuclease P protein subunit [Candidatus Poseidoniaceae archaeon]|tara:strand:+ start:3640 stop:3897 length:258 start_codon:yes stop_codon:yes gene_type:complete
MSLYNSTWIGSTMNIVESNDPTLIGRSGLVMDETKNTLVMLENDACVRIGKSSITFTLDGSDAVVQGALVGQRPEDRTNRKYRMA